MAAKTKTKNTTARPKLSLEEINAKIVEMMTRHSPLGLTFSNVSRWTQVPRSTLYYYYGNSREKMIEAAVEAAVKAFVVLGKEVQFSDAATWDEYQMLLLKRAADVVEKFPWAPELYFRFRTDQGYIGEAVRKIEEQYFQERSQSWTHYFPGREPAWESLRMSSVLKLGSLYGLFLDQDHWLGEKHKLKREKLMKVITRFVKDLLQTDWSATP